MNTIISVRKTIWTSYDLYAHCQILQNIPQITNTPEYVAIYLGVDADIAKTTDLILKEELNETRS